MANVYVDSNAVGGGTGADWANAYTTLTAALTAKAAGDSFWVAHNHGETQGSAMTLTSPGTAANPCFVYCVNSSGTVPPVSADLRITATISTTANSGLTFGGGYAYVRGITFNCGSGAVAPNLSIGSAPGWWKLDSCALVRLATTAGSFLIGSSSGANRVKVEWINTTIQCGNTGDKISFRSCDFSWKQTPLAIAGATLPTNLFNIAAALDFSGVTLIEGVDLSVLGSGKTLVSAGITTARKFVFKDCRLGASVTVAGTPDSPGSAETILIRCDSGGTNYRSEKYQYMGTQTAETTIVRTGGATDGVTPLAWKIATTANSKWVLPFEALPITIWNDTSNGSTVTVAVYGIWGGAAVPNNDDIWIEAEYLGASGTPLGSFATGSKADNLATGAAHSSDASIWGGSTTAFKMTKSFVPLMKGPITIYVKAAAATSTFYIDPRPVLS